MITNANNKPTKAQLECSYARPNFQGSAEGIRNSLCHLLSSANIDAEIKVSVTSTCKGPRSHANLANDLAAILLAASSVKRCTLTGVSPYYVPPTAYYRPESFADCEKLASCDLPICLVPPPEGNMVIRLMPFQRRTASDLFSSTTDVRPADLVYVPHYVQQWGKSGVVEYDHDGQSLFNSKAAAAAGRAKRVRLLAGTLYERPGTDALARLCRFAVRQKVLTIEKRTDVISVDAPMTSDSTGKTAPARVAYQPELSIIGGVIWRHFLVHQRFILRAPTRNDNVNIHTDKTSLQSVNLPRAFSNITTVIAFVLQTKAHLAYLNLDISTNRVTSFEHPHLHPMYDYFAVQYRDPIEYYAVVRESLELRRYAPSEEQSGYWLTRALGLTKGWDRHRTIWDLIETAKLWDTYVMSSDYADDQYRICAILEIANRGELEDFRPILDDDACEHLPAADPVKVASTYFKDLIDPSDHLEFEYGPQAFITSLSYCKKNDWLVKQVYLHEADIQAFMNGRLTFEGDELPEPKANMRPQAAMALYSRYVKQFIMVILALISMVYFGFTQGGVFFLALTLYYCVLIGITVMQASHPRASNLMIPPGFQENYNIRLTLMSYNHKDQQCLDPVSRHFNLAAANPTQTWDEFQYAYSNEGVFGVLDDYNRLVLYTRGAVKEYGFVWYYAMNTVMGQPHIQLAYLWPSDDPDFEYPAARIQAHMDYLTSEFDEFQGDAIETTVTLQSGCIPVYEDSWFIFTGRSITPGAPNKVVTTEVANELYQFAFAKPEVMIEAIANVYKQAKAFVIQQLNLFNALNLAKGRPSLWSLPSLRTMLLSFAAACTLAMRESLPKMAGYALDLLQQGFSSLTSTIHTMYCSTLTLLGFHECRLFVDVPHANSQASSIVPSLDEDQPRLLNYPRPSPESTPFFDSPEQNLAHIDINVTPRESSTQVTPTSTYNPPPEESEQIEQEQPTPQTSDDPMTDDTNASSNQNPSHTHPMVLPNKPELSTTFQRTSTLESLPQSSALKSVSIPTSQQPKDDPQLKSLVTIRNEQLDIVGPVSLTFRLLTQVSQRDYESASQEPFAVTLQTLIPEILSTTLGACRPMNSTSQAASTQASASRASSQSSSSAQPKNNSSQKESSSSTSTQATTTSSSTTTALYPRSSAPGSRRSASTSARKTKLSAPRREMSSFCRVITHEFTMNLLIFSALWLSMILFGAWPSLMLAVCLLAIRHSTPGLPLSLRTFAVVTVISLCLAPSANAFSIRSAFSSAKSTLTSTFGASNPSETPSSTANQLPSPSHQPTCEYGSMLDLVFPPTCKYELSSNLGQSSQTGFANFWKATKSVASASWDYIAASDIVADVTDVAMDLAHSRTATKLMNAATLVAETASSTASTIKTTITDTYDKVTSTVSSKVSDAKEKISEAKQEFQDSMEKTAATIDYLYDMMPTLAYNEGYNVYVNTQVGPLVRSDALSVDLTLAIEDGRPSLTIKQYSVTTFTMAKSKPNNNKNTNNQNAPNTKQSKNKKQRLVPRLGYRQRLDTSKDPYVPFMRTVLDPAHAMQYNATAAPLRTQYGYVLRHFVNEFAVPAQHRTKITDCWYFLPDSAVIDAFMVYKINSDPDYHTAVLRNPSTDLTNGSFWSIAKSITLTHMGPAKDRGGIFYGHRATYIKAADGTYVLQITRPLFSTTNLSGIYATNELASLPTFAKPRDLQSTVKYTIAFPDGTTCTCPDMTNSDYNPEEVAFWTTVVHYIPPSVGYTGLTAKVCTSIAVTDKTVNATCTYNSTLTMPILEIGLEAGLGYYPGSKNDLRQVLNTVRDFWKKNRTWIGAVSSLVPYGRNITAAIDALAQ